MIGAHFRKSFAASAYDRSWHECDIARSRMDVRFRGKSGHASNITAMTGFDPTGHRWIEMPQRSGLVP
jgi:hypothetical protein